MKKIFALTVTVIMIMLALTFSAFASDIEHRYFEFTGQSSSGLMQTTFSPVTSVKSSTSAYKNASLPEKYDSRTKGVVTSVKNQGEYGACWSFAAMASAESSILSENKDLSADDIDFSEVQHAYFTLNSVPDEMNLTGDVTTLKKYNYLDVGGNTFTSTASFAKWFGVSEESVSPYEKATPKTKLDSSLAYGSNYAILENAYWINSSDRTTMKKMIMKYGAMSVSYYHDNSVLNTKYNSYYYPVSIEGNHQVTVVGWDDNFSASKFGTNVKIFGKKLFGLNQPSKNGAWLIKNSYGDEFGNDGYFWVSYYDKSLLMDVAAAYDFQSTDTYDNNYQYDGGIGFSAFVENSKLYAANVFTATGNQILKAISLSIYDDTATYKYQIYLNPTKSGDPTSGTPVFSSYQNANIKYCGYNTVVLPSEIQLGKGDTFAVVMYIYNKGEEVYALADASGYLDSDNIVYQKTTTLKGQSYVSSDGKEWSDVIDEKDGENLKIKAFTCNGTLVPTSLSASPSTISLAVGESKAITFTSKPENSASAGTVSFKSSDTSVATVSSTGKVTAKKIGSCTITITSKADTSVSTKVTIKVTLAPPKTLAQGSTSTNQITVKWSKVDGASGYKLYVLKDGNKKLVATTTSTSYTIKNLKAGTKYSYYVRSFVKNGSTTTLSAFSSKLTATTNPVAPTLKISKTSSSKATISWNKVTGVTSYVVYKYNSVTKKYVSYKTTTSTKLSLSGLKSGNKFIVKAVITLNGTKYYSSQSNAVTFK